jgi:hypothetical protein
MHIEGISRQTDRNAIIDRHEDGWRSRRAYALHSDIRGRESNIVLLRLLQNGVENLLIGLVRVRRCKSSYSIQAE